MSVAEEKPASPAPLDAILQKVLDAVPFQLSADEGVEVARQRLRELPRRQFHPDLRVEDHTIDGPAGAIPIRVYWPPEHDTPPPGSFPESLRSCPPGSFPESLRSPPQAGGTPSPPVIMYFHGGGFAVGDLDTHDGASREHAVGAGAMVVSVDYRLAPEHPYPAAVDDAWAATRWVAENAGEFGADPTRLAVAGDSAGGTLSAVVAQLTRDEGGPPLRFQLLWYPATMWDTSLPSFAENAAAPVLDGKAIGAFTRWYAGHVDMTNPPATLAPGRVADLSGLAPAYIAVAGHDPLRDDGTRYGELLAAAGVPVDVHNAETLVHGYLGYAGVVPAATEAVGRGLAALRAALHR